MIVNFEVRLGENDLTYFDGDSFKKCSRASSLVLLVEKKNWEHNYIFDNNNNINNLPDQHWQGFLENYSKDVQNCIKHSCTSSDCWSKKKKLQRKEL